MKKAKKPLRQTTICLLVKPGQVLLAMKKVRFGKGKWNGVGGKPEPGETIEEAAIRETFEEINVRATSLKQVATLNFFHSPKNAKLGWEQQTCVFIADKWEGEPTESEEMQPQWFEIDKIPYQKMWPDDTHWLPRVLSGKIVLADFLFDDDLKITEYSLSEDNP